MNLKNLSNSLKLVSKEFKRKNKNIWDIILYGSIVRGREKLRDIDIAIILSESKPLSYKLNLAQNFKHILPIKNLDFDVRTIDFYDILDKTFLARQGILTGGFSLLKNKFISEYFGFKTFVIFTYNLKGLSSNEKRIFSYILTGRRGYPGLIKKMDIKQLGRGVLRVPIQFSEEIQELLEKNNIKYKKETTIFSNFV